MILVHCLDGEYLKKVTGLIDPNEEFEKTHSLNITSAIETTDDKGRICLALLNRSCTPVEAPLKKILFEFELDSPDQAKFIIPIDQKLLTLENGTSIQFDTILNKTILAYVSNRQAPNTVPGHFWFSTPENCENPDSLTGREKRVYESLVKFREQGRMNPENSSE